MTVRKTEIELKRLLADLLAAEPACVGLRVGPIVRVGDAVKEGNWDVDFTDSSGRRPEVMAERAALAIKARLKRTFHLLPAR